MKQRSGVIFVLICVAALCMPVKAKASYLALAFEEGQESLFDRIHSAQVSLDDFWKQGQKTYSTVQKNLQDPEVRKQLKATASFLGVEGLELLSYYMGPYGYVALQCGKIPLALYGLYHSSDFILEAWRNSDFGVPKYDARKRKLFLLSSLVVSCSITEHISGSIAEYFSEDTLQKQACEELLYATNLSVRTLATSAILYDLMEVLRTSERSDFHDSGV